MAQRTVTDAGVQHHRGAEGPGQLALELRRIQLLLGVYQSWIKSLGFVQKRLVSTVQGIVVKGMTPLDGNWKPPAVDLAHIWVEPERCFEQATEGPRW